MAGSLVGDVWDNVVITSALSVKHQTDPQVSCHSPETPDINTPDSIRPTSYHLGQKTRTAGGDLLENKCLEALYGSFA